MFHAMPSVSSQCGSAMDTGAVRSCQGFGLRSPGMNATPSPLTTTGAKTGKRTVSPVMCAVDGDRLIVYASAAGSPNNPAWYHNIVANPEATVELGSERFAARATEITGAERDRLWAEQVARVPSFGAYARNTTRVIPVVALDRIP